MILIYDNECSLCTRFKKAIEILDTKNKIKFVVVSDPAIYLEHPELNQEECEEVVHLIHEGKIYRGGEVITELAKSFPGVQKFAWLLDSDAGQGAMSAFYNQINNMRVMKKHGCFRCGKKSKKVTR